MARARLVSVHLFQHWQALGWVSALDLALVNFVAQHTPEAPLEVLVAVALLSRQLAQGHVCLDLAQALRHGDQICSGPADNDVLRPSQLLAQHDEASWRGQLAAQSDLVAFVASERLPEPVIGNRPLVLVHSARSTRLYLARYWRAEQALAGHVYQRLQSPWPVPEHLAQQLAALFPQHHAETDWQQVACALACRSGLTIITGGPGTGKTTTVIRLLALLQEQALQQGRALRIRLAAPTGKAAARLTTSIAQQIASLPVPEPVRALIPAEVSTVHRLLGSRPDSRRFRHHRHQPLALDVLVVDEASMIDLEMMASLLDALPPPARLILLGDKDQLASVEAGAVLGDLCLNAEQGHYSPSTLDWLAAQCGHRPDAPGLTLGNDGQHALAQQTVMLRHSHRFAAESDIGQFALAINRGDVRACQHLLAQSNPARALACVEISPAAPRLWGHLLEHGRPDVTVPAPCHGYGYYLHIMNSLRPAASQTASDSAWQDWAWAVLQAFSQFQLLTPVREGEWGVTGLNPRIARHLHRAGLLAEEEQWPGHWYEGRPVLVTRNDYGLGVMNGDVGICLRLPDPQKHSLALRVAFPHPEHSGQVRFLHPSRLNAVESAFAMTVHKSQGSEFSHAALVLPEHSNPVLSRELLYTAVTRARHSFTLILHEHAVLHDAIRRRVERQSGLQDLLWGQGER